MEESRFNALVDDFKDWCDKNGVEYTEISGTYYNSNNFFAIADFTAQIAKDGGTDIVLACATNFNDNQKDNLLVFAESFLPIDVYGQTDRQVGVMNDDDQLSAKFLEYIQTEEAKAILMNEAIKLIR